MDNRYEPPIHNRFGDLRGEDTCVLLSFLEHLEVPSCPRIGEQGAKGFLDQWPVAASVPPHDIHKPKDGLVMPAGAMAGVRGWGSCHGEEETAAVQPIRNWGAQWMLALGRQ